MSSRTGPDSLNFDPIFGSIIFKSLVSERCKFDSSIYLNHVLLHVSKGRRKNCVIFWTTMLWVVKGFQKKKSWFSIQCQNFIEFSHFFFFKWVWNKNLKKMHGFLFYWSSRRRRVCENRINISFIVFVCDWPQTSANLFILNHFHHQLYFFLVETFCFSILISNEKSKIIISIWISKYG